MQNIERVLPLIEAVKEGVKTIFYLSLIVFVGLLCDVIVHINSNIHDVMSGLVIVEQQTAQAVHDTRQDVAALLLSTGLAADQLNEAAAEQRRYWAKTSRDTDTTIQSLNSAIEQVSKDADSITTQTQNGEIAIVGNIDATQKELEPALLDLQQTAKSLSERAADPSIGEAESNLAATAAAMTLTAQHGEAAMKDIQEEVHRVTRPVAMWKQILNMAIHGTVDGAQVYVGVAK